MSRWPSLKTILGFIFLISVVVVFFGKLLWNCTFYNKALYQNWSSCAESQWKAAFVSVFDWTSHKAQEKAEKKAERLQETMSGIIQNITATGTTKDLPK
jgi:hypothetical protein